MKCKKASKFNLEAFFFTFIFFLCSRKTLIFQPSNFVIFQL
ncbi:hypothetical protein C943_01249 [Mariniradius saccharolyticus AK6]|uniref:Uncharacterized protein n=1 Tax=Mariniradius saccharolyticus AK6 TaxID=1239962 RepID=M7XVK3_9BACT|nr:hypothetical protein C943_01249 [Mariniradius saccharolyticus AK6]